LLDGTIDCVVSDHAPRRWIDKACEFDQALPGISSLETAFGLLMRLVHAGDLSLAQLIAALTLRPAQAWGLPYGTLSAAHLPTWWWSTRNRRGWWTPSAFFSKGQNSPLAGQTLRGTVLLTIAQGKIVYRNGL
jgi:dihydroorotase